MPNMTIGDYLLQRLAELGVRHLFGVPGDFVLRFMTRVPEHGLELVNCCDEQGAGFAADAYARITGLGVVCVTYGVGGLKIANSTAQAFAERSPVVIISGAPGIGERAQHPLIHHRIRDFDTQRKVFEQLTVASAVLDDPETALPEIDRVLEAALRYKRPVYLELPRDRLAVKARHHHRAGSQPARSDAESLAAALDETIARVRQATQPVVVLGEEVHRFQLQETAVRLLREAGLPAAATILGKSVIDEDEPNYLGVYQGGIGREDVARFVESSDCVLLLGVMMTDVNLGIYTASLDRQKCIHAVAEKLSVGLHVYEDVLFEDFINGLAAAAWPPRASVAWPRPERPRWLPAAPQTPLTVRRVFQRLDAYLEDAMTVIADPGDALFGAVDLTIHESSGFLSPAYYNSLGFAVPAALGAQLAAPTRRPLVLVGDGAFQMTGMELSTIARYGLNPIVMVLNNHGYLTERYILDGGFNDLLDWNYHRVPAVLGVGWGVRVQTEGELDEALTAARARTDSFCLIEVVLDRLDASDTLRRIAEGLRH